MSGARGPGPTPAEVANDLVDWARWCDRRFAPSLVHSLERAARLIRDMDADLRRRPDRQDPAPAPPSDTSTDGDPR